MAYAPEELEGSERVAQRLLALNQVALRAQEALDMQEVFRILGEELKELGLDCAIFLLDKEREELELAYISLGPQLIATLEKLLQTRITGLRIPLSELKWEIPIYTGGTANERIPSSWNTYKNQARKRNL